MNDTIDNNPTAGLQTKPRSRWRRVFAWLMLGAAAGVLAFVAFLPSIASLPMMRGLIADMVSSQVNGRVSIGDLSLSWFGSQTMDNLTIVGKDPNTSVTATVSLRNGLFDLVTGSVDQIDVTLRAALSGSLDANGALSLLELAPGGSADASATRAAATAPNSPATSHGVQWPTRPIHVTISSLDANISNAAGPSFALSGLKARLSVSNSGPLEIELSSSTSIAGKPGAISASGTFSNCLSAAGDFDPVALNGSLHSQVDGLLLPVVGATAEISRSTLSITALPGKPIDLRANLAMVLNGRPATVEATLVAARPNPKDHMDAWVMDPRTWSGSVIAREISTSLLEPFTRGTPIQLERDVGAALSLQASTNSATGFDLLLASEQVQLRSSARIDVATGAVHGEGAQLAANLSPALLKSFNVITPSAVPVTVSLSKFFLPPVRGDGTLNVSDLTALGSMDIGPLQLVQGGGTPVAMGPLSVTLSAAPLASKVDFTFDTTLNGSPVEANAGISGLIRDGRFSFGQMGVSGTAQMGPFDPTLLPGIPAQFVDILSQVQPGPSTIKAALEGSMEKGSLNINTQCAPGVVNALIAWDPSKVIATLENTAITLAPSLVKWASQDQVVMSTPAKCKVAAGPIQIDRLALESGKAEFSKSPVSILVEQMFLTKAPGLAGPASLQNAVLRGEVAATGPQLFKGSFTANALMASGLPGGAGNVAIRDLSIQASIDRDFDSPASTLTCTVASLSSTRAMGLNEAILANNMLLSFTGPLSFKGESASTLKMDVLDASGLAAKISGEIRLQSMDKWNAALSANEVSVARIARFAGLGEVPEWTTGGAANAGTLQATVGALSGAVTFALDTDLGRVKASIHGSRGANGSIALSNSSARASVPGDAARNLLDRGHGNSPVRNLSDINVSLEIASLDIPSINGQLSPLAPGASISTKARVEPFQVTFATELLSPGSPGVQPDPVKQPARREKMATLNFDSTDVSLQTSGAQSAQINLAGAMSSPGMPAKPMGVKVKAQNLAGADGKLNVASMKLVAGINISEFPSSLLDAILEGDGFIQNLAGPVFSVQFAGQTGFEDSDRFRGHVESSTLTLDIPAVRVVDSQIIVVPSEAIVFQLRPDENVREHILRPINPILGDIEFKNHSVNATVTMVRAPLPLDMAKTDARFSVQVGEVELEKSGQLISLMNLATVKDNKSTIPGLLSPLNGEINRGILTYKDFTVQIGKMGNSWQQTIFSEADINLTTQPPYANFIRVRYPLEGVTNAMAGNGLLGKSFADINSILGNTTAKMRQAVQVKVTFSGPLVEDQLHMKVEPNLDLPKGDELLKGLGDIAEGILGGGGKSGQGTTTPPPSGSPPQQQPKDVVGGLLDKLLKKPKN